MWVDWLNRTIFYGYYRFLVNCYQKSSHFYRSRCFVCILAGVGIFFVQMYSKRKQNISWKFEKTGQVWGQMEIMGFPLSKRKTVIISLKSKIYKMDFYFWLIFLLIIHTYRTPQLSRHFTKHCFQIFRFSRKIMNTCFKWFTLYIFSL